MIIGLVAEKPAWTRIERLTGADNGDCALYWADPAHPEVFAMVGSGENKGRRLLLLL
jgi:hypothetical protein